MNSIQWYAVPNPEGKRYPEWRRSFGVTDMGSSLFLRRWLEMKPR